MNMQEENYKNSYSVTVGGLNHIKTVLLGGDNPVAIQTMWKNSIADLCSNSEKCTALVNEINNLQELGCDLLRFAVPDMASADALIKIADQVTIPLVADIHFDYRLALRCLEGKIAKIRINPGNIGSEEKVKSIIEKCSEKSVPIRIGVNSGSLPKDLLGQIENGKITRAQGLFLAAEREIALFDACNFSQFLVSMKASNVAETIECNKLFAKKYTIPLHLGVTEAGPLIGGIVKTTAAFMQLLPLGIGSTIRVSLSSDCKNEIFAAKEILRVCNCYSGGVEIISCPRCGRNGFDVHGFLSRWQEKLESFPKKITVAVMGCVVNGPGEAKNADIGISGAGNSVIIFKQGKIVRTIDAKDADIVFSEELETI